MEDVVQRGPLTFRRALVALVIFTAVPLFSCFPWDNPSLERSQLVADPAAKVRMPGADELAHFAREREFTVEGPMYAFDRYAFGTAASEQEVIAFYDKQLRALGWTRDDLAVFSGSTDLYASGWCKPRMAYRLAIKDKTVAFAPSFYRGETYVTVYDAGLQAKAPDAKCGAR